MTPDEFLDKAVKAYFKRTGVTANRTSSEVDLVNGKIILRNVDGVLAVYRLQLQFDAKATWKQHVKEDK